MRTYEEALDHAESLLDVLEGATELLVEAWQYEDHLALDMTWGEYCDDFLGGWSPPKDKRLEIARELSEAGMVRNEIAAVLGVSPRTIQRDMNPKEGETIVSPDPASHPLRVAVAEWKARSLATLMDVVTSAKEFIIQVGEDAILGATDAEDTEFAEWFAQVEAIHAELSTIITQVKGARR